MENKRSRLKVRKGKKKWFPVKAPGIYNKALPEITAYEPAELVGRTVLISMKELTGSSRDSNINAKFEIVKVQGDTAITESIGLFVQDAQISRVSKRARTRITFVFYVIDKDGKKIKFKVLLASKNLLSASVQNELRLLSESIIEKMVKKMTAENIFTIDTSKKVSAELKKQTKPIYPLNDAIIWKASIVQ